MKFPASLFILWLIIPFYTQAQIVSSDPDFPTASDSVIVYFDATQGTGGLKDFTGDVYAHTGVITENSTSSNDWKYVITDWPDNVPKIKLERIEPNLYKLDITPSIREYYGVPEGEKILKMAFVFRNADGTKQGKADGGADIFVKVYETSFNVKFLNPEKDPSFLKTGETLNIKGVASATDNIELSLLVDGQLVKQVNNDTLAYAFSSSLAGKFELSLIGSSASASDTLSKTVAVYPEQTDQNRPANLKDGVTYVNNSIVRLSLFAPYKEFVYVIGDFTNWQFDPDYFMHRDMVNADSTWFWIEIDGLTPGQEYAFQYLVDGEIRVTDPYVHKILDPFNDQYIPAPIYPNLKPYPEGKTEHIVGVLQPGKDEYNWQTTHYDRPENKDLVIYELLIRDFLKDHDFETLIDTLDYLDRLGINAIELMPVMEFDANSSWGYNPTFLFAVDKYYGPAKDLKRFIDEAHSRDIAVILDMVLNHAWGPSPFVRLWNDGVYGVYGKPTLKNPYLNRIAKHDYNVGYDFNHESAATQYLVDRVTRYWLSEFHFDGFRFDLSKGFTQKNTLGNTGAWGQYDPSRIQIWKNIADHIWSVDDSAYVILEHFAKNKEEKELSAYGMMLWGNMNFNYNEATMGYHDGSKSDFSWIYYGERGWSNPHVVGYMESHDEQRLMYKNLQFGNSSSDGTYNVKELPTALNRIKIAGAFFFTIPGPKMIWQFGELGYDIDINENGRTGEKPIKWEYFENENRKKLYKTFQALIRLRGSHPAFTSPNSTVTLQVSGPVKRITIDHPDMDVSIIGNFGVTEKTITPDFSQAGTWYTYFRGDSLAVTDTDTTVSLRAGEFFIYTTKHFSAPEAGLIPYDDHDTVEPPAPEPPAKFKLYPNYPNPFSQKTTIVYQLPEAAEVTLDVFNILGQRVFKRDLGQQSAAKHELPIDFSSLASGVYIYRLVTDKWASTRKMMLIK